MTIQAGQTATAADMLKSHKSDGMLEFDAPTELTIASGVITATQNFHTVDTQSDAATDDLDTINGGTDGFVLVLVPINDARTIVVKHNTGNIKVFGDADITLDDAHDCAILIYNSTTSKWMAIAGKNYDGHINASANVHGLPASVNAFGNRDGAGRFMQSGFSYITGNGSDTYADKAVTFPVAFTTLHAIVVSGAPAGGYIAFEKLNFVVTVNSTTGFTTRGDRTDGAALAANNYGFYWIAIGA